MSYIFLDAAVPVSMQITSNPLFLILVLVIIALAVLFIVKKVKKKKTSGEERK